MPTTPVLVDGDIPSHVPRPLEASRSSSSSSSSSSESERSVAASPSLQVDTIVVTRSSRCVHRAVRSRDQGSPRHVMLSGFRPHCNRRIQSGHVWEGRSVHTALADPDLTSACELCFPSSRFHACPMLCGAWMSGGCCAHRCVSADPTECAMHGHSCQHHLRTVDVVPTAQSVPSPPEATPGGGSSGSHSGSACWQADELV